MKKKQLAKRVSALTMAAALSVSAVAADYMPLVGETVRTVSFAEETKESSAEFSVSKSEYPMFLDLVTTADGENGFTIKVDKFDTVSSFFDFTMIISDGEQENRIDMDSEGFDVAEGEYLIEITAKGEDNPYDLSSFTDGKFTVTVNTGYKNAHRYDYNEGGEFFYYIGNDTILSPVDYDTLFVHGRDDDNNIIISSQYGENSFDEESLSADAGLIIAAELRQEILPESGNYFVERFTDNEDMPYFYGEKLMLTPVGAKVFLAPNDKENGKQVFGETEFTVGTTKITAVESYKAFIWDDRDIQKPMEGFTVEDTGDTYVIKLDSESDAAANKQYRIYESDKWHQWDKNGLRTINEPYTINKSDMKGDMNFNIILKDIGEHSLSYNREYGSAQFVDNSNFVRVKANKYFVADETSVWYTSETNTSEHVQVTYDEAETASRNDGYKYYKTDLRAVHEKKNFYVDFKMELSINLVDATDGESKPLENGIASYRIIGHKDSEGIWHDMSGNSFDLASELAARLNVTVDGESRNEWRIDKITYNGSEDAAALTDGADNSNEDVDRTVDITFNKTTSSQDVTITFASREYVQHKVYDAQCGEVALSSDNADGSEGTALFNTNTDITAKPKVGYYVKTIKKNDEVVFDTENGSLTRQSAKLKTDENGNSDGTIIWKDTEAVDSENTYTVIFEEAEQVTDYKRSFAVTDSYVADSSEWKSFFNTPVSGDYTYNVSCLVKQYTLTYNDSRLKNVLFSGEDYSFAGESKVTQQLDEGVNGFSKAGIADNTAYFIDKITGKITCDYIKLNVVEPDIKVTSTEIDDKSLLKFLSFGIFGNDSTTITFTATDVSAVPIKIDGISFAQKAVAEDGKISYTDLVDGTFSKEGSGTSGNGEFSFTVEDQTGSEVLHAYKDFNIVVSSDGVFSSLFIIDEDGDIVPANDKTTSLYLEKGRPTVKITAFASGSDTDFRTELKNSLSSKLSEDPSAKAEAFYNSGDFNAYITDNNEYWVNKAFQYKVQADDAVSGIESVNVDVNGNAVTSTREDGDGFISDASLENAAQNRFEKLYSASGETNTIKATAEDIAGNSASASSGTVSIDSTAPTIESVKAVIINPDGSTSPYSSGSWTNKPVRLTITASDNGSGVYQVLSDSGELAYIGEENAKNNVISTKKTYTLDVQPSIQQTFTFSAKDNVGNQSKPYTFTVNTEDTAPVVRSFNFIGTKADGSQSDVAAGSGVQTRPYGYYFQSDTTVHVNADDNQGKVPSGLGRIEYILVNSDEIESAGGLNAELLSKKQAYVITDISNPDIRIPAFWSGQVVVRVVDKANNGSAWITPDGLVLETRGQHDSESHVELAMPSSPYTTVNTTDVPLYSSAPVIPVTIKDKTGIRSFEWTLYNGNGGVLESGSYNFNNAAASGSISDSKGISWSINDTLQNLTQNISADIPISGSYNGNNLTLSVTMTCNSGHQTTVGRRFSIDGSVPVISDITFDGAVVDKNGKSFCNTSRSAVITVTDDNFDASAGRTPVTVKVTNAAGNASGENAYTLSGWTQDTSDPSKWRATLTLNADAEYTEIGIEVSDLVGHKASKQAAAGFVIDRTKPSIIGSFDNNSVKNGKYYNSSRKAIIKINDHNFVPSDVNVRVNSYNQDNVTPNKDFTVKADAWKQSQVNKDEWTAEISFKKDGRYNLSVDYTDPAGNRGNSYGSGEFYIDTAAPKITQTFTNGGADINATNGDLKPYVKFSDFNLAGEAAVGDMCKVEIRKVELDGTSADKSVITEKSYLSSSGSTYSEYEAWFDIFEDKVENDGIYKVKITAEDLAGNQSTPRNLTVSINRYGSTFEIVNQEAAEAVERYKRRNPVNENPDIIIREINVTDVTSARKVTVVKNGSEKTVLDSREYAIDTKRHGDNEEGWYETLYTIDKECFSQDGVYLINIESTDLAGNVNSNNTPVYIERKCNVEFSVDKTIPEVIIAGVDDGALLKESKVQLRITCVDHNLNVASSFSDEELTVAINGNKYSTSELKDINGTIATDGAGNIVVELPVESNGKKSSERITVTVMDKAGNVSDNDKSTIEFTLSASFWDMNKGLLIALGSVGLLGIIALIIFIIMKRKKRY